MHRHLDTIRRISILALLFAGTFLIVIGLEGCQ